VHDVYIVLLSGERIVIIGSTGADTNLWYIYGFASANLTELNSAIAIKKSAKKKPAIRSAFFFTGYPCFIRGFSCVKAFLSRFLDQPPVF
jgi:hypothetical protein